MSELNEKIAIKVSDLYKSYGKKEVLKGVNFEVREGELFGFVGKNGVGKSTTIDCILGAKTFQKGDILINNMSMKSNALEIKKYIGYVASEPTCYKDMTGLNYLQFIASIYGIKPPIFMKNLEFLMDKLDFKEDDLYRIISEYSHGMQQKICLMASLIHNPKLWILDEPTVGLDQMTTVELSKLMKDYVKHGNTCMIASHNIELVARLCDRVAMVKDGKIEKIYDLKREPALRSRLANIFVNLNK